jgi:hypothetical protein
MISGQESFTGIVVVLINIITTFSSCSTKIIEVGLDSSIGA